MPKDAYNQTPTKKSQVKNNLMNQTGYQSNGPRCWGTQKRKSFVDIRDDDIPGPGSHNSSRIDKNTPTKWKFGTGTERDTFLEKHPRPNPSPFQYNPNPNPTLTAHPEYSFPRQELQNPAGYKDDENSRLDNDPNSNVTKNKLPSYSFGYFQERDYSTQVPPPNSYEINNKNKDKRVFNKTQNYFYKADRPLPYGEWGYNPGVGEYHLNSTDPMNATAHKFAHSEKLPDAKFQGVVPIKHFHLGVELKQPGKGFTMRPFYQGVKNKDVEVFPAPNHYNPKFLQSRKKIISFTGPRSELYNEDHIKYPSPQKHVTSSDFYKKRKSLSFTKQIRYEQKPLEGPGPAKYHMQKEFSKQCGYMGRKLKDLPEFITPAGSNYDPVDLLTKPTPQRVINYHTNRVDFSRSITGNVGPGDYLGDKDAKLELGKMSKSLKFQKNRNKNPGPGFYQIPTSIGSLPKYYAGKKKLTSTGYSTFALEITQKTKRHEQWLKQQQAQKQRKEAARRKQAEQAEQHNK